MMASTNSESGDGTPKNPIVTATRIDGFRHTVATGAHEWIADEPVADGGEDAGPSPTRLLAAALAACTAITMEMYADRKDWELPGLSVAVEIQGELRKEPSFEVVLDFPDGLSAEQKEKLTVIAGKCPVHRTLTRVNPIEIRERKAA